MSTPPYNIIDVLRPCRHFIRFLKRRYEKRKRITNMYTLWLPWLISLIGMVYTAYVFQPRTWIRWGSGHLRWGLHTFSKWIFFFISIIFFPLLLARGIPNKHSQLYVSKILIERLKFNLSPTRLLPVKTKILLVKETFIFFSCTSPNSYLTLPTALCGFLIVIF